MTDRQVDNGEDDLLADAGHGEEEGMAEDKRSLTREERLEEERRRLLASLARGEAKQQIEEVAWILNTQPITRDSDIALQVAYWKEFEPELYQEFRDNPLEAYPKLPRLTSLARSRAKIQNDYRLFQASREVRQRRKQLDDDERERQTSDVAPSPTISVYADESGKTGAHLLIGSIWFVDPADTWRLTRRIVDWRREAGFTGEFHFSDLTENTLA